MLTSLDRVAMHHASRRELPFYAAAAYLSVWGLVGLGTWAANTIADTWLRPHVGSEILSAMAGGCLVLAGVYGLSPLAASCLRSCWRPFGFLARHWRGGPAARRQAATIGLVYGASCVGCCVPMLGVMLVTGMANIAIVIALGVVMVLMKLSTVGPRMAQMVSVVLIGLEGWALAASGSRCRHTITDPSPRRAPVGHGGTPCQTAP